MNTLQHTLNLVDRAPVIRADNGVKASVLISRIIAQYYNLKYIAQYFQKEEQRYRKEFSDFCADNG